MLLDDRKGIRPVKPSASKSIGVMVNVSKWVGEVQSEVLCRYEKFQPVL